MKEKLNLDYFYGIQAEQFTFYKIPKILITDKRFIGVSSDAKILYGLMLDRMSLSMKSGWIDNDNRVFIIFSIKEICEKFECSKDKAMNMFAELDSAKGVGLIERVKRGLGLPDIIYIKNFATLDSEDSNNKMKVPPKPINSRNYVNGKKVKEKADTGKSSHPGVANNRPLEMDDYQPLEVDEKPYPEVAEPQLPEVAKMPPQEVAKNRP